MELGTKFFVPDNSATWLNLDHIYSFARQQSLDTLKSDKNKMKRTFESGFQKRKKAICGRTVKKS